MPRYKLTIEYDGTPFNGWQKQGGLPTVQAVLEAAVSSYVATPTEVWCAGRTDAGVHATGQVAHVDLPEVRDVNQIVRGVNNLSLPHPVVVVKAEEVSPEFHARFDAKARHYHYKIVNRPARTALDGLRAWYVRKELDVSAMREAAAHLVGHHDFSSFRSNECQSKSPIKTLDALEVSRDGEQIDIHVSAKSFLHNQVRIMVGTLALVGRGKWTPADVKKALDAKNRIAGGTTAPACGLYLTQVDY
jgi:tRNA pseudouridine38-40 synthase